MKFNFNELAADLDGNPLKNPEGETISLNKILAEQMSRHHKPEMTFDDKEALYATAKKLNDGGDVDLSPEDLVLMKEVAAETLSTSVCGQLGKIIRDKD